MFSYKDNVHKVEKYDVDKIDDLEELIKFENAQFASDDDDDDDSLMSDSDTDLTNLNLDFDFSNPNVTFVEKVENVISKHSNANLRTLSILNRAQVSLLQEGIKRREKLLEECRTKRFLIRQQIEEIQKEAQESMRTRFYILGAPFFKNNFYAPPNEDALQRKARGELSLVDLPTCKAWLKTDKDALTIAVRKQSKQIRIKNIEQKMQRIVLILKKGTVGGADAIALKKELKCLEQSLLRWQSREPSECVFRRDERVAVDWLKIMTVDLQGRHDDEECKAMWYMYLHPDINKSAWSKTENASLQKLAAKYNYQDWNSIASELATNRSEHQCCVQFQTKLTNKFKTEKWTSEEDAYLLEIIDLCRIANYIPWGKVSYYIRDRTRHQIYMRFKYTLSPEIKKGKFSLEEDVLLLGLVDKYGKDFPKIATELPNRTAVQIRERYTNVLQHEGCSGGKWTIAEDEQILNHIKAHGTDKWAELAKVFVSKRIRNRTHLRHRYTVLKKFFTKYPDADISLAPRHRPRRNPVVTEEMRKEITDGVDKRKSRLRVRKTLFEKREDVRKFPTQIEMPERPPQWSLKDIKSELTAVYGKHNPRPRKPIKRDNETNIEYTTKFRTMIYSIYKFIKENKTDDIECKTEAKYLLIVLRLLNFTVNIPEVNNSTELIVFIHQLKKSAPCDPLETDSLNEDLSELFEPNFSLNYFISVIVNFKKIIHYVYWNEESPLKDLVIRKWGKLELAYDFTAAVSNEMTLKQRCVKTYARNKNGLAESSKRLTNPENDISSDGISHAETIADAGCDSTLKTVSVPEKIDDIQRNLKRSVARATDVGPSENYTQGPRYRCQETFKTRLFALFTLPSLRQMLIEFVDEYAIVGEKIIQDNKSVKKSTEVRQRGRPRKICSDRIKLMNEVKMKKRQTRPQTVDAENPCAGEKRQLSDAENPNQGENIAKKVKIDILKDIKISV